MHRPSHHGGSRARVILRAARRRSWGPSERERHMHARCRWQRAVYSSSYSAMGCGASIRPAPACLIGPLGQGQDRAALPTPPGRARACTQGLGPRAILGTPGRAGRAAARAARSDPTPLAAALAAETSQTRPLGRPRNGCSAGGLSVRARARALLRRRGVSSLPRRGPRAAGPGARCTPDRLRRVNQVCLIQSIRQAAARQSNRLRPA